LAGPIPRPFAFNNKSAHFTPSRARRSSCRLSIELSKNPLQLPSTINFFAQLLDIFESLP
jgi:hypothetical protein